MFRTSTVLGAVFAISLVGAADSLVAQPTVDVNVINREITPVQFCVEGFINPVDDAFVVPDNHLLVIEDATVRVNEILGADQAVIGTIVTTVGETTARHFVGLINGRDIFAGSDGRTMKLYADPGTMVGFGRRVLNSQPELTMCASGRLERIP